MNKIDTARYEAFQESRDLGSRPEAEIRTCYHGFRVYYRFRGPDRSTPPLYTALAHLSKALCFHYFP